MRRLVAALIVLAALLPGAVLAAGDVRIVAIQPSRGDSTLDCTVVTSGLPDGPSRETLASGLPSSITLSIALLDASGRERGGSRAEIRVEPNPWERMLVVRTATRQQRLETIEEVSAWMQRLGPFRVAPLGGLDLSKPIRFRVRLAVHPLAPAELERTHALFSGDMGGGGSDRREVSAGLGSLLRYFLGRSPSSAWQAQLVSDPFDARALTRTP